MSVDCATSIRRLRSRATFKPLSDVEIKEFIEELDTDDDGFVTFEELTTAFYNVQAEISENPSARHQEHTENDDARSRTDDLEKGKEEVTPEQDGIQDFLRSLMPNSGSSLSRGELIEHVKTWNVPSQNQNCAEDQDEQVNDYHHKLSWGRRARAYWAIHGPKKLFRLFIVVLQLAFGLWQLMSYVNNHKARAAFGWGVVVAKGSAGALYPTLFFM
jgi:FtsZ-binding cell division protein ZapB